MKTLKCADGEMALAHDTIQPHSLDVQGILRDANNNVASKTFRDLPTEIRLLSKLRINIYATFYWGFSWETMVGIVCTTQTLWMMQFGQGASQITLELI